MHPPRPRRPPSRPPPPESPLAQVPVVLRWAGLGRGSQRVCTLQPSVRVLVLSVGPGLGLKARGGTLHVLGLLQ